MHPLDGDRRQQPHRSPTGPRGKRDPGGYQEDDGRQAPAGKPFLQPACQIAARIEVRLAGHLRERPGEPQHDHGR